MKTLLIAASLILLSVARLDAFNEPDGFLGIKWGTSVEEAQRALQNISSNHFSGVTDLGGGKLVFTDSLGGVITKFSFTFENDKFTDVLLRFAPKDFETMEKIFVRRYGKAMQTDSSVLTNAMGAKFINKTLVWIGEKIFISLQKYHTINDGYAVIGSRSQVENTEKQKRREIDDAVKNM